MKISGLKLEQWMKVEVANMTFKPNGVISIGGENGSGKSSLWAFLLAAFKGKVELPDKPVRNKGAKQALGTITLDGEGRTAFVEVEVGEDRDMKVNVRQKDGPRFKSPATMLKALVNSFSFDPFSIMKLRGREQRDTLLQCLAVNFDDLEEKAEKIKEQRSIVSRDVAGRQRQLDHMEVHAHIPDAEIDVSALVGQVQQAMAHNKKCQDFDGAVKEWEAEVSGEEDAIRRLEAELVGAKARLASARSSLESTRGTAAKLKPVDIASLQAKLAGANETNAKVRANQARANMEAQFKEDHARFAELGEALKAIDAEKQARLAKAKAPVDGLEFTDDGVLFNGLPLSQDSGSGQMIRAVELVAALNPELRTIFIDDAERLMLPRLEELGDWAEKNDFQVLCFRASTGGECEFLMVDGKAVENA